MTITEPRHSPIQTASPSLRDAITQLDDAATAPHHMPTVTAALDTLFAALDHHDTDLLDEIERSEPRLGHRVAAFRHNAARIAERTRTLRHTLDRPACAPTIVRNQLAGLARALRQYQSTESDIIFDALNTDVGAGD